MSLTLIDTAGLSEQLLGPEDTIEKAAQQKSVQMLEKADLVLLVLDNSQSADQLDTQLLKKIAGKKVLMVLNKCDLPTAFDISKLPENLANAVQISAKLGTGVENLIEKIRQVCGVADFDLQQPVCFTGRQENLLKQMKDAKSKQQAASIIAELLNAQI